MDLGRWEWFEAMMNAAPEEKLLQIRRTTHIREEGREEGKAELIRHQLTRRFGTLPATIQQKIAQADSSSLERWGDRLLDAGSLDEVFAVDSPESVH
ncbi:MAG: DUF4351 domain-containing protein, partial [Magnetococcales bacterium]|nr:DUF4351 domain-containing protein [Magnetococcales bacterium]